MNATLVPGASLSRIAEIVRNAVLFGPDAWEGGSRPARDVNSPQSQSVLPTDRDVEPLLERLQAHLEAGDMNELRGIVRDIEARIARFEQLKKP